ncbi:G-protein alpha subunit-domain-containing protein [Globomyces pollinis-pini]|nr:G-protein alpha subunit-domain-containing protein [Globomyces pollinis-pini]
MEEDTKKMQTSFRYHRDSVFVVPTSPTAAKKSIENLKKSIDNLPKLFKSRKEDNQQNVQKTEDPISVDISIEVMHSKDKPPSPYFTHTSKLARIKSFQEKPSGLNTGRIRSASFRGIERPYTENSDSIQDLNNQKPLPQKLDHNLPSRPRSSSFKNFVSPSTDKLDIPTCNIGRTSSIKQLSLIKKEIAAGNWLKSCSSFASSIASSFSRNSSIDFARRSNSSMGSARSLKLQREESKKIDSYLAKEKQKFEKTKTEPRLLILGTSDSGKSTFLKQLKILHGHGFDESDLQEAKTQALGNIIAAAESLLFYCTESIQQKYSNILKFIAIEPGPFDALPLAMCRQLTSMWTDPAIQIVFQEHENSFSPNIY